MPDNTPDQEPSIEEILASIRQIISDDDEVPAEEPKAAAPEPVPEPVKAAPPPPPPPPPVRDDVLELTEIVDDHEEPEPMPEPEPVRRRMEIDMREVDDEETAEESILTPDAASATLQGFAKLSSQMALDREGSGGITLEDIVKQMLRPMLREWIDGNLPRLIEKLVQKELDQIARRALDD